MMKKTSHTFSQSSQRSSSSSSFSVPARGYSSNRSGEQAKSVGSFFPKLTRPVFEKFGFASASLVADWAIIVGPHLAEFSRPEKLKWPHTPPDKLDTNSSLTANTNGYSNGHMSEKSSLQQQKQQGATLILRVDSARSLEMQYSKGQIIERINTYFGYKAVTDLRILQAPLLTKEQSHQKTRQQTWAKKTLPALSKPVAGLDHIKDNALRSALEKMARGIQSAASAAQISKEKKS